MKLIILTLALATIALAQDPLRPSVFSPSMSADAYKQGSTVVNQKYYLDQEHKKLRIETYTGDALQIQINNSEENASYLVTYRGQGIECRKGPFQKEPYFDEATFSGLTFNSSVFLENKLVNSWNLEVPRLGKIVLDVDMTNNVPVRFGPATSPVTFRNVLLHSPNKVLFELSEQVKAFCQ
ncbi:hypothetical protein AKO1_002106 [Acrasis kona]|uniref:Uncharacterized protein n=1 Tax=Acrasis kona TaxID=1008807 RepID=A0AAW2YI62_9EUKA